MSLAQTAPRSPIEKSHPARKTLPVDPGVDQKIRRRRKNLVSPIFLVLLITAVVHLLVQAIRGLRAGSQEHREVAWLQFVLCSSTVIGHSHQTLASPKPFLCEIHHLHTVPARPDDALADIVWKHPVTLLYLL